MSRIDRHRITRKLASIGLAMAVTMSLMPVSVGSAYAEDGTTEYLAAVQDGIVAEDVSAAEASLDLEETLTAELSDDTNIESIDIETEDFAASDEDILSSEDILDISVEEDAGLEEDGIEELEIVDAGTDSEVNVNAELQNPSDKVDVEKNKHGMNEEHAGYLAMLSGGNSSYLDSDLSEDGLFSEDELLFAASNNEPVEGKDYSISAAQKGSIVTVTGWVKTPYYPYGIQIDSTRLKNKFGTTQNTKTTFTETINMNQFDTGYHTLAVGLVYGKNSTDIIAAYGKQYLVSNNITARPNSNGVFDVYSSYFNYYPYGSFGNSAGTLYMEYSANGGKTWQRSGYMKYNLITTASAQGYKIGGLRQKTTYKTRIRYGVDVKYEDDISHNGDGKTHTFYGPVLNTTTIKTGSASKPKIKSVTLKATKVKYHKLRWPGYYNVVGGSVFWHNSYVEKFYTAKVKVTVKLKKKPGTAGVFISLLGQTKWKKGNKKKYTVTFTPTYNYWVKNPHSGKYKLQVQVYSGQNSSWGGYSPVYSKKKKVR